MYVLWKTSKEFGVNVDSLSERIISQMMFTNVYSNRLAEVLQIIIIMWLDIRLLRHMQHIIHITML